MRCRSGRGAEVASQRDDILLLLVQLEDLADAFGSAQERLLRATSSPVERDAVDTTGSGSAADRLNASDSFAEEQVASPLQEVLPKL